MGHNYTGVELRPKEVDRIRERMDFLGKQFELVCGDSRHYAIEPEAYDFSYSCPPYYDLEVYSEMDGDMSNADTYEDFLSMIKDSLEVTYAGLKPDALCAWVVGNFRDKKGCLRHFNGDLVRIAKEIGFDLWDEIIYWGASGAAYQRAGQFVANRKIVRVHEYVIILKKPINPKGQASLL